VGCKRDVVLARQRARQIARLLGFDPREQVCLAAAVFEIACTAREDSRRPTLEFRIRNQLLEVFPVYSSAPDHCRKRIGPGRDLRLEKLLPERAHNVDASDLAWIVQEVGRLAPVNVFEEMRRQNQELLWTLHEVQTSQAVPVRSSSARQKPAA
jgi:hypothetical protein